MQAKEAFIGYEQKTYNHLEPSAVTEREGVGRGEDSVLCQRELEAEDCANLFDGVS
jgi:hypothetical protein